MPRTRAVLLVLAAATAAALALPSPAFANPFPNNGDLTVADNYVHTYCFTSGFTTDASVGTYGMSILGSTTDMKDLFPPTPATCSYMETDIWWWETNLLPGVRGERDCWLESPAGICTSSDLRLDYGQLDIGNWDWEDRRKTAVHEVGHSVGLGHRQGTVNAMKSGGITSVSLVWRNYHQHDIDHINAYY